MRDDGNGERIPFEFDKTTRYYKRMDKQIQLDMRKSSAPEPDDEQAESEETT